MGPPLFAVLAAVAIAAPAIAASPAKAQAAPAEAAAAPAERDFPDLTSGRYEIRLSGMLCSVCTRAILAELVKLDDVASARADLERGTITIAVKPKHLLTQRTLRHALRRAAKRADIGTQYDVAAVKYIP